jgi:P-type Ca2+ transporter type 2C
MRLEGLKEVNISALRGVHGYNELPRKKSFSALGLLFSQFKNPLIYVLFAGLSISFFLKEYRDVLLILGVVLLNVGFGFYQEYGAHKTLEALTKILRKKCIVIRDGDRKEIETRELVPGDIVVVGPGDRVAADGILKSGSNILVNEAILTGEVVGVTKTTGKKSNGLYMGTTVLSGVGLMEVEKIGIETQIGKIGKDLGEMKINWVTPLQKRFEKFTKHLTVLILILSFFLFWVVFFREGDFMESFKIAVILAVATIPEALPMAVAILMAIGMKRILKKQGLVKKMLSLETLGSTSVICTDKTGTLTEGKMSVVESFFENDDEALKVLALTNDQRSSLEMATWEFVEKRKKIDPGEIAQENKRIFEDSFDSKKKYVLSINRFKGKETAYLAGAPEIVMDFCDMKKTIKDRYFDKIDKWAKKGLKVIAVSKKEKGQLQKTQNFEWLGIVGLKDPIRKGAKKAINEAFEAGIEVKMVTGDYVQTAIKVAKEVGIDVSDSTAIEGKDFEKMSEEELEKRIPETKVFARVTPHQKLKIVDILRAHGEVVAMTGDGVNDALALKKSDIGVAMENASDVSKEASDLILLDGDFSTIMAACEEGRLMFANIKKLTGYVLSDSFVQVFIIVLAMSLGYPLPMTILQILWIQFVCDVPLDIALAFEPKSEYLMKKKPKEINNEEIIDNASKILVLVITILSTLSSFVLFRYFYLGTGDLILSRTVVYVNSALITLFIIFSFKNPDGFVLKIDRFFNNMRMIYMWVFSFSFLLLSIYLPYLNRILETVPLSLNVWIMIFFTSLLVFLGAELFKLFLKRLGVLKAKKTKDS